MTTPRKDRVVVRDLAKQIAEVAALPIQQEKADMWRRLNRLDPVRPMVMLYNGAWNETLDDSLGECTDEFCRNQELYLRRILYQWEHMPGDMVVEGTIFSPVVIHNTGWGVEVNEVRPDHYLGAVRYEPVIREEADIEKIKIPQVTVDWEATEETYHEHCELYDGILRVEKRGMTEETYHEHSELYDGILRYEERGTWGFGFAIFDQFIQWRGLHQAFLDMVERPAWLHQVLGRMTEGMLVQLDTLEKQGALSLNNGNVKSGPGGLAFTDELPQPDFDGVRVRPKDLWAHATTQIFAGVSPAMHEEFALRYEKRFLERFGLASYGCCEPLHRKVDIIKKHIPNLRRLSMSPWADVEVGAHALGSDCIFSYKPNPAALAAETWHGEAIRAGLRNVLERTKGCVVEIIMTGLYTCRNEPHRMWDWTRIATEVAEEFAA